MAENGLTRGSKGLEVNVMCEIPSNVSLAFEWLSIGAEFVTYAQMGASRSGQDHINRHSLRLGISGRSESSPGL